MSTDWFLGLLSMILGALSVAAIGGVLLMYRQVGQLAVSVEHFGQSLEDFARRHESDRNEAREDRRALHERIDSLVRRQGC